jgi:hypothetical protein
MAESQEVMIEYNMLDLGEYMRGPGEYMRGLGEYMLDMCEYMHGFNEYMLEISRNDTATYFDLPLYLRSDLQLLPE